MYLYILLAALVAYVTINKIKHYYLSKKWGCKPAKKLDSGFLGIKFVKNQLKLKKDGQLLEKQGALFTDNNASTVQAEAFGKKVFLTCAGENMKAVLGIQYNDFGIGYRKDALNPLIGHGVFASEGDRWKTSREMLRPQFAREQVGHLQTLEPHILKFASIVKAKKGEPFDMQEFFHRLTIDAASEFLFGESTNSLGDDTLNESEFADAFNDVQDTITTRLMAGPFYFLVSNEKFKQNLNVIHSLVQHYVDIALSTPPEDMDKKSKGGYILLYEIVKKTRDRKVLQDELLSILLAGRNTTAGLLSFLFYELARNPPVFHKLKDKIRQQFGYGEGETLKLDNITFESMKRCTYLKYCINEALRLHPPVGRNARTSLKDTTIPKGGGDDGESPVFVPKGSTIAFSIYSTHRQPHIFGKDSCSFRPERWENLKPGWDFMPFGSGPRICLGQQFALTEASYVTIRLLQNFDELQGHFSNDYPPPKIANATLRLRDGCVVSIK